MKRFLIHTASIFLSVVILIATSGFTVFHHSCKSTQISEFSFIVPEFSCEHFQHQEKEHVSSCCNDLHTTENERSCADANCCNTESFVVKSEFTLYVDNNDVKEGFFYIIPAIISLSDPESGIQKEFTNIIISNDLPPPLAGKDLHIYLNQLNIPSPTV